MPFKADAERRRHMPKPRHRVTDSAAYDMALRQRGRAWHRSSANRHAERTGCCAHGIIEFFAEMSVGGEPCLAPNVGNRQVGRSQHMPRKLQSPSECIGVWRDPEGLPKGTGKVMHTEVRVRCKLVERRRSRDGLCDTRLDQCCNPTRLMRRQALYRIPVAISPPDQSQGHPFSDAREQQRVAAIAPLQRYKRPLSAAL